MFKRILCPSDLSEASILSIKKGVELATMCGAELILLNVRPEFMDHHEMVMLRVSAYDFLRHEKDIAIAAKEILAEELRRAGGSKLPHRIILREGDPQDKILKIAEELECDLVILTTTGRNHILEHIKGSDAEQMVSDTHVPILVLPVPRDQV